MKPARPQPSSLITDHLDTWTSAIKAKSSAGRGSGKKEEFYGIKKLRELILELAVRGLLVPQDPSDEPASELLKKIASEKSKLTKAGIIKKGKKNPLLEDDLLFEIPPNWEWTTLGDISEIAPRNTLSDDTDVAFVPMPLITTSYDGAHAQEIKTWGEIKKGYTHFSNGDIAIAKITPCFENSKAAIFKDLKNGYGAGTTELHVARLIGEFVSSRFILLYLKAPMFLEKGKPKMTGSAGQKRIPASYFTSNPLPLPPLAEQKRIVAKVDELMALCDRLEQQQEDSVQTHATLVQTLLAALTTASEHSQFTEAWQRIAAHFDTLFTTESSIDQLKQTILQLAVMGKLVPQDPNDEPASELLKRIAAEKAKLAKAGIIKSEKPAPQISKEEFPLQIPNGWTLARFQSLPIFYHVGLDRGKSEQGTDKKYRYFKMNNILNTGGFDLSDIVSVDASDEEIEKFSLVSGDLLFNTRNSQELVGKTCVFHHDDNGPILYNNNILRARFSTPPISAVLDLWMRSPSGQSELEKLKSGTTNVWAIYQGKLEGLVCPIPPLAEQHRIVAKVNELMALCDRLKANLQTAQTTQLHLADTLVSTAIN